MDRESDGHIEILKKDRQEQTESNARKVQGFWKSMIGLKREEQREKRKCRIKEGKLGISAM